MVVDLSGVSGAIRRRRWVRPAASAMAGVLAVAVLAAPAAAWADQAGVPFWLSGQMPSLAATPRSPGWSVTAVGYDYNGSAGISKDFQIGQTVVAGISTTLPILVFQPGYAPKTKLIGGQAYIGVG